MAAFWVRKEGREKRERKPQRKEETATPLGLHLRRTRCTAAGVDPAPNARPAKPPLEMGGEGGRSPP